MVNAILAKRVNHIVTKGDNPAWPKGSKSRGFSTYKEFIINMEDKMQDDEFLGDTKQLLRPDEEFNPHKGYEVVRTLLIDRLQK